MYPNAKGCDLARYQAGIDYEKAIVEDGMRFFILKVCQIYPDPVYEAHHRQIMEASQRCGIKVLVGGYLFVDVAWSSLYTNSTKAINYQLDLYRDTLIHSDFPICLDIEGTRLASYGAPFILELVTAAKQRFGCPPIIYTAQGIWQYITGNKLTTEVLDCPLWVANYGTAYPNLPYPWITWEFWQTGTKKIGGLTTDFNYYRGTEADLYRNYVHPETQEPVPIDGDIQKVLQDHEQRLAHLERRAEAFCGF